MQQVLIEAESREMSTKHNMKTLRAGGKIPAILYGGKEKNINIAVDAKSFEKLLASQASSNLLVNIKVGDQSKTAIVKEIQRDMLTQKAIHIDFQMISLTDKIEVSVHLHIKGEAPGVKLGGGILEHVQREVKVKCLPTDIPKVIDVDVTKLEINQALFVRDIPAVPGVEILTDPNLIVVNIVAPTILEEPAAGAEAAVAAAGAAEPEIIKKGKKEEEGEAVPAADEKAAAAPKKPEASKPTAKPEPGK